MERRQGVLGRNFDWASGRGHGSRWNYTAGAEVVFHARPSTHTVGAPHHTTPTSTSGASLYLSNWSNIQALWDGSKLKPTGNGDVRPRIAELQLLSEWGVNQINDYTGFSTTTDNVNVRQPQDFTSRPPRRKRRAHGSYGTYNGSSTPIQMERDFVMVPNEPFDGGQVHVDQPFSNDVYNWTSSTKCHVNNEPQ